MSENKLIEHCSIYGGLCSTIQNSTKQLFADDPTLPPNAEFARLTVKVRTIGTNSYIGIGTGGTLNLRFTAAGQAMTWVAPVVNNCVVPFKADAFKVLADVAGGAGVLEISGTRVYRCTK